MNIQIHLVPSREIWPDLAWAITSGQKTDIYCPDGHPDAVRAACARLIRGIFGE